MFKEFNEIISVKDLCKILMISRNTAYKLIKDEIIPSSNVGRQIRIQKQDVIKYLRGSSNS